MAKLPYGFDARQPHRNDEPWIKLRTVREYLEDCEPIPADLAHWLGEAIKSSKENPDKFLQLLGLKKRRGKPSQSGNAWLLLGERICELERSGTNPERAIETVLEECSGKYSRTQLQTFRDEYRAAWQEAHRR